MRAAWPGPLGLPPDAPSIVAVVAALVIAVQARRGYAALVRAPRWAVLGALSVTALALSAAYVHVYLAAGPRIIDATSYWLEARALAEGHVTWPIEEPTAAARGRFLLASGAGDAPRLGVIFPPGYPVVLAVGFLLGAPLAVGPVLAALLVLLTYALAREVSQRDDVARIAAVFSVLSAALRYHTADTMSHGWAAALVTATLLFAYRMRGQASVDAVSVPASALGRKRAMADAALAGLSLGWLLATRPASGAALFPLVALVVWRAPVPRLGALALAALVPCALFAWQQRVVTGALFRSSQAAYYALADGPPGCFRYGFGSGVGCLHEHGAYVRSLLPDGLDARAAMITTLRRLRLHLLDIANAEPLALLVVAAPLLAGATRRALSSSRAVLELAAAPLLIFAAYAGFYFDGSYPGGGARLFADVLPVEHVLMACALPPLATLLQRRWARLDLARATTVTFALALLGFAVHAVFEHHALCDREGGRPFYEPSVAEAAGITKGLLLVGTDHGFNLAYDPDAKDAARELIVAREHGDDRDRLVWDKLGRPPAYRYAYDVHTGPSIARWWPPYPYEPPALYRYEAEAEWPPLAQSGGDLEPVPAQGTCAWGGALLAVHPAAGASFHGTIAVPVPFTGRFRVAVHVASRGDALARFALRRAASDAPLATWTFAARARELTCASLPAQEANLQGRAELELNVRPGGEVWVDAVALEPSTRPAVGVERGPP